MSRRPDRSAQAELATDRARIHRFALPKYPGGTEQFECPNCWATDLTVHGVRWGSCGWVGQGDYFFRCECCGQDFCYCNGSDDEDEGMELCSYCWTQRNSDVTVQNVSLGSEMRLRR